MKALTAQRQSAPPGEAGGQGSVSTGVSGLPPHSVHEPSYTLVGCCGSMRCSARASTLAVTPVPQLVTMGRLQSTPAWLNACFSCVISLYLSTLQTSADPLTPSPHVPLTQAPVWCCQLGAKPGRVPKQLRVLIREYIPIKDCDLDCLNYTHVKDPDLDRVLVSFYWVLPGAVLQ